MEYYYDSDGMTDEQIKECMKDALSELKNTETYWNVREVYDDLTRVMTLIDKCRKMVAAMMIRESNDKVDSLKEKVRYNLDENLPIFIDTIKKDMEKINPSILALSYRASCISEDHIAPEEVIESLREARWKEYSFYEQDPYPSLCTVPNMVRLITDPWDRVKYGYGKPSEGCQAPAVGLAEGLYTSSEILRRAAMVAYKRRHHNWRYKDHMDPYDMKEVDYAEDVKTFDEMMDLIMSADDFTITAMDWLSLRSDYIHQFMQERGEE